MKNLFTSFRRGARLAAWTATLLASVPVLAISPSTQLVPAGGPARLNSVVQVVRKLGGANSVYRGGGSIIGKFDRLEGTNQVGYFCVLTADHVARNIADAIGFGNGNNPPLYDVHRRARRGPTDKVDIALLWVRYGVLDTNSGPAFDAILPLRTFVLPNPDDSTFSQIGLGGTGPDFIVAAVKRGYQWLPNSSRTKRFQNNVVTGHRFIVAGGYCYDAVEWLLDRVGVRGEGCAWYGDCGGPYLYSMVAPILVEGDPLPYDVRTEFIIGVHTLGSPTNELGQTVKRFAPAHSAWGAGVHITAAYDKWIRENCERLEKDTRPVARVERGAGSVTVSWPDAYNDYTLQATTNLTRGSWRDLTERGSNSLTLPASGPGQFFRLIRHETDVAVSASAAPGVVSVSNALTYTVTVANRGPSRASGVVIELQLPGAVFAVSSLSATQGICSHQEDQFWCEVGALPVGQTATMTVTLRPGSAGNLQAIASASASEEDPLAGNDLVELDTLVQ